MWPNPQFPADLATFLEEILNGKLHFLCSKKGYWDSKVYAASVYTFSVAWGIMRHLVLKLNITPERTGHNT